MLRWMSVTVGFALLGMMVVARPLNTGICESGSPECAATDPDQLGLFQLKMLATEDEATTSESCRRRHCGHRRREPVSPTSAPFVDPQPTDPPLPAPIVDKDCFITGATQTWCEDTQRCETPSQCKSYDGDCSPDAHGCITCDGMVPCGSSCQHQSIPCREPLPAPTATPQHPCPVGGALQMWCEEESRCVAPSTCKSFVEQNPTACLPDAGGCIPCDGEVLCGSSCQPQSIPCDDQWGDHDGPSYIGVNIKNEARCGKKRMKLASNSNSEDCAALASGAQEANDLEHPVLAYSLGQKLGVNIGDCWAELDVSDTLVASWQKCKDEPPCAKPECPLGDGWLKDPMFDFFYLEAELDEQKADHHKAYR